MRREVAISRLLARQRFSGAVQLLGSFEDEGHIYLVRPRQWGGGQLQRSQQSGSDGQGCWSSAPQPARPCACRRLPPPSHARPVLSLANSQVQESCAGGDLYRRLVRAGGTLPEGEVCRDVVVPLLLTLTFLHASHIVHRCAHPDAGA